MKARGIIFTGPSIPAIGDGRKTQTRRVIKPQPIVPTDVGADWTPPLHHGVEFVSFWQPVEPQGVKAIRCPYGIVGDHLWIRETWGLEKKYDAYRPSVIAPDAKVWYLADGAKQDWLGRTRSPMHMPRWASRKAVELTKVGAERLQMMSYADWVADFFPTPVQRERALATFIGVGNRQEMAAKFWDSLNAKRGHPWDNNDWVWAIQFKVL